MSLELTQIHLRLFNPFNLVDRPISAALRFMMWTYLSALVFLFIARITYINLKMHTGTNYETDDPLPNTAGVAALGYVSLHMIAPQLASE